MKSIDTTLAVMILLLSCLLAANGIHAEPQQQAPLPLCAADGSPWRDFDFFIGDWDVFDPDGGQRYGRNTLVASEQGCLLMGSWVNVNGGTGSSMNVYDPLKQQWRQIWQSPPSFIDQYGRLDEQGRMQMEGQIYYHGSGLTAPFKGTWSPIDADRFLQEFWQYDAAEDQWNLWFRGEYQRIKPESNEIPTEENAK